MQLIDDIVFWFVKRWRKFTKNYDISIAEPSIKRPDLLVGYYSTNDEQPNEVKAHVNLNWETQFQGVAGVVRHMQIMKCSTVLDVSPQLYTRKEVNGETRTVLNNKDLAEDGLRELFDAMAAGGVLRYVLGITPIDEPNHRPGVMDTVPEALATLKKIINEYNELTGVNLVCIYATGNPYGSIEMFDWVGFDDYGKRTSVLEKRGGLYGQLTRQLRSTQKTIIIPGGTFGQDPVPFINFAHANKEVVAVLGFLWHKVDNLEEDFTGIVGSPEPLKNSYIKNFRETCGK